MRQEWEIKLLKLLNGLLYMYILLNTNLPHFSACPFFEESGHYSHVSEIVHVRLLKLSLTYMNLCQMISTKGSVSCQFTVPSTANSSTKLSMLSYSYVMKSYYFKGLFSYPKYFSDLKKKCILHVQ